MELELLEEIKKCRQNLIEATEYLDSRAMITESVRETLRGAISQVEMLLEELAVVGAKQQLCGCQCRTEHVRACADPEVRAVTLCMLGAFPLTEVA